MNAFAANGIGSHQVQQEHWVLGLIVLGLWYWVSSGAAGAGSKGTTADEATNADATDATGRHSPCLSLPVSFPLPLSLS